MLRGQRRGVVLYSYEQPDGIWIYRRVFVRHQRKTLDSGKGHMKGRGIRKGRQWENRR